MAGTVALLETFHSGQADSQLGVNIGASNRVATFKTTGLNVLGGSRDVGQSIGFSAGLTNWGGYYATNFSTTQTLDMDNFCITNYIKNFLVTYYGIPATYADGIETVVRPLYSLLSFIVKDLQNKKVI